ncbi:DinB family protein [Niallia sp. Krafla_26]|uniref:DinB family protein n=1 Tax=Niallia sp. Krafla_26 TaxID=3064703 RepID=UPI003D1771F5
MKDPCIHLLQYDHWANVKLLEHIDQIQEDIFHKTLDSVFPTISETFYHIYRAHRIWFKRCLPLLALDESVTEFHSIEHAKNSFNDLYPILIDAIDEHYVELGKIVYQNQKGTTFENEFDDIIHHLANHGTYHRGNIAAMIRQNGCKGTSTDYIQYLRDVPRSSSR